MADPRRNRRNYIRDAFSVLGCSMKRRQRSTFLHTKQLEKPKRGSDCHGGSCPEAEDDQEMKDSVKSADCIEKLAHKYMQKCIVESSTESDSESGAEVMHSPLAGGLKKTRNAKGQQFLDPYDGDSEDAAIHSDCSVNCPHPLRVAHGVGRAPKAAAVEGAKPSGGLFSQASHLRCPEAESHDQSLNACHASMELPRQEQDLPRNLLQPSELTKATEALGSMWLTPIHCSLRSEDSAACAEPGAPQPMQADTCDTACSEPLSKRKQGLPVSESADEKQRKKLRAT